MSSARERADRIHKMISILDVLSHYGYPVRTAMDREQQFPCDLHGDGLDRKFSARVYPDSDQWYCFSCDESRDAIDTVQIKEGVKFGEACRILEKRFGLPTWKWTPQPQSKEPSALEQVTNAYSRPPATFEDASRRMSRMIDRQTQSREWGMEKALAFWESFDYISYLVEADSLSEAEGKAAIAKLRRRIMENIQSD